MSPGPDRWRLGPDRAGRTVVAVDGAIVFDGVGAPPRELLRGAEPLACADALIAPGAVNAHTHLYSGLVPFGVPLPTPWPTDFVTILEHLWWRLDRALDAATLRAAARVAIGEALLAGTTTLVDHHESPGFIAGSLDVLAEAAEALGVRAWLCYGATERNGGRDEAEAGLAECARLARALTGHPRLGAMVGLHAGFTVSDRILDEAVLLARALDVGLHVHVAEAPADVAHARALGYAGALDRLAERRALGPRTILAHGIHVDALEVARADLAEAWFVQNPRSNRGNGVGYPQALTAAHHVALGTDGYPSDMGAEVAIAREEGARVGEPPGLAEARLRAGSGLVRQHRRVGSHAPDGDLIARGPEGIRHVLVDGRAVVRDGGLIAADLSELRAEARAAAAALVRRMHELEPIPGRGSESKGAERPGTSPPRPEDARAAITTRREE